MPTPAAHYAVMFETGHAFAYEVAIAEYVPHERNGGKTKWVLERQPTLKVTCEVADVATFAAAVVSQITCTEDLSSNGMTTPQGVWAATDAGLIRLADGDAPMPTTAPTLSKDDVIVSPAKPKAKSRKTPTFGDGYIVTTVSKPRKNMWCTLVDMTNDGVGDSGTDKSCFQVGRGLVSTTFRYNSGFPYNRDLKLVTK